MPADILLAYLEGELIGLTNAKEAVKSAAAKKQIDSLILRSRRELERLEKR